MKQPRIFRFAAFAILLLASACAATGVKSRGDIAGFIDEMVVKHQFERKILENLFAKVQIQEAVLRSIAKPAEAMPWHKYRQIFLTQSRIDDGVLFWRENEKTLAEVERRYGVPPAMIVAVIGVETRYGIHTGAYRVIDALTTLGFEYPKRARFFRDELEHFLLLCRDEGIDPLEPKGSYAGAMGFAQFMPSSFRRYAADFEGDNRRDIWNNRSDAIASVANYFAEHGWRAGEAVTYPVKIQGTQTESLIDNNLKPEHSVGELARLGVILPHGVAPDAKAALLKLDGENGPDYWLGLHNFYVITRYNHSPLYAMAVYQLSREIEKNRKAGSAS